MTPVKLMGENHSRISPEWPNDTVVSHLPDLLETPTTLEPTVTILRSASKTLPMINVSSSPDSDLSLVEDLVLVPDLEVVRESPASTRHAMSLLANGVPLSLLFDLVDPAGPASADIASSEDASSLLGDLMAFRANAAEGTGAGAKARAALRALRFG
jgi:hypothetical protein